MTDAVDRLDPRRVLAALNDAVARLEAADRARAEPIAIVGMSCRFPGDADDPSAFWRLLADGRDATTDVPRERWAIDELYDPAPATAGRMYTRRGGFIRDVDRFDAAFFEISPREAVSLDPQQRLLLEVSWEALEDAGQPRERLEHSQTGVFIGATTTDYSRLLTRPLDRIDTYFGTGNTLNATAGRLSYVLGLHGPSLAVDTACSSSLVAMHLACQSLRARECDAALAGGVNLVLTPEATIALCQARMLAADGRCKTFDARADGYGRGEGCGVLVLKRLSDAIADRDRILALVRGSAVNQDGATSGFTVPNGLAQRVLLRRALENARVAPADVDYIEAHGTGTALGDPIELRAVAEVFGEDRDRRRPILVGSVKTNIGHLESAAGMAGLIKTVLSLQHEAIPAHLHFERPNPHFEWDAAPIAVSTDHRLWPRGDRPRIAGVSSFGASGTNAHVIVEEAPAHTIAQAESRDVEHVLTLSAKTQTALRTLAGKYAQHLADHPHVALRDVCFSVRTGRSLFGHRVSIVARSSDEARAKLMACVEGRTVEGVHSGGLDAVHECDGDRVPLPSYPWERERFWPETPDAPDRWRDWLYTCEWIPRQACGSADWLPRPNQIREALADRLDRSGRTAELQSYSSLIADLERRVPVLIARALAALGCPMEPSQRFSTAAAAARIGAVRGQQRLLTRVLQIVEQGGFLARAGDEWEVVASVPAAAPAPAHDSIEDTLVGRAVEKLGGVLRGEIDGVEVLFPTAPDAVSAADLYQRSPIARAMNQVAADAIARCVAALPADRPIRILELGAGTGATTAAILPNLPRDRTEYVFTDVSPWFLSQAQQKLSAYPFVRFETLDLERAPSDSRHRHRCDVVIAANVVHATRDVRASVRHIADLLAPSGMALLVEQTAALRFVDAIFGLTPGWWRFDDDVRRDHPLLPADRWKSLFTECGFEHAEDLTAPGGVLAAQSLIVASAAAGARTMTPGGEWLVVASAGELRDAVAAAWPECAVASATRFGERAGGDATGVVFVADIATPLKESSLTALQTVLRRRPAVQQVAVVTRGAQPAGGGARVTDPVAAEWIGFAKSLALEHPSVQWRRIDLDPAASCDDQARALLHELTHGDGEDDIAFGGERRYVARLRRHAVAASETRPSFDRSRTYVITGGTGGLGLLVARWLVERGARHLVLVSRSGEGRGVAEAVSAIERMGAMVRVARADVSKRGDIEDVFAIVDRSPAPIGGVIHAAGVLADGLAVQQTWDRVAHVLAPKVDGAWHLHELTKDRPIDCFVMFSSAVSIVGSAGQANHAAANAFLDALAHHRRARGLPALAINWGPWSDVGAAASRGVNPRMLEKGTGTIPPDAGLRILDRLWSSARAQVAVAPIDWPKFIAAFGDREFFAEFRAPASRADETRARVREEVLAAPPHRRSALLTTYVRGVVARVLRLAPERVDPAQGFFELGMDSLTSMELRARLQADCSIDIPATIAFDRPSVDALARFLGDAIAGSSGARDQEGGARSAAPADAAEPDADELARMLGEKLRALKKDRNAVTT